MWRHSKVLKALYNAAKKEVEEINSGKKPKRSSRRPKIMFVRLNDESWSDEWVIIQQTCRKVKTSSRYQLGRSQIS